MAAKKNEKITTLSILILFKGANLGIRALAKIVVDSQEIRQREVATKAQKLVVFLSDGP